MGDGHMINSGSKSTSIQDVEITVSLSSIFGESG